MSPTSSASNGFGLVPDLLFAIWPLLIVLIFLGHKGRLSSAMIVWLVLLVVRIFRTINTSTGGLAGGFSLIPEPTSTLLFFAVGGLLIALLAFRRQFFG